ncbi:DUF2292 domain-containing protein [Xylanibacillus composti]|uniref:DUF2292 domain-containing protein n=1 Tax=Xylanibacillus composti TaxID=1572762 RepID=A0A8J4H239_9BACL|nr:YezD family protein [Xylanibacillus composti]MDT9726984.1 DUF2292 domain-containing protein [Xylanibacillus composti]GIQ69542.1 hypothetical protein XYCOK13_23660 [Xylanibacillus composti]
MRASKSGGEGWDWKWLLSQFEEMKFGSIQITIHDGKVVQVDRTEKFRSPQASAGQSLPTRRSINEQSR